MPTYIPEIGPLPEGYGRADADGADAEDVARALVGRGRFTWPALRPATITLAGTEYPGEEVR